ncbi:hypothetical protein ACOMHN_027214 [Nucella lapillus]
MLTMGPVPKENQTNPEDKDRPCHSDSEDLETPNHVVPPAVDSSTDDDMDSDGEGPAGDGYTLLPQDEEVGGDGTGQPQAFPPQDSDLLPAESMTEVRGEGIDVSQAVAEGNLHPAFAASFPDNKVPDLPKVKKDDIVWNHPAPEPDRLQLDSAQLTKVKSAMVGFQLPKASIPDWAQHIPEDQWKQVVNRLTSPVARTMSSSVSAPGPGQQRNEVLGADRLDHTGKGNALFHLQLEDVTDRSKQTTASPTPPALFHPQLEDVTDQSKQTTASPPALFHPQLEDVTDRSKQTTASPPALFHPQLEDVTTATVPILNTHGGGGRRLECVLCCRWSGSTPTLVTGMDKCTNVNTETEKQQVEEDCLPEVSGGNGVCKTSGKERRTVYQRCRVEMVSVRPVARRGGLFTRGVGWKWCL